MWPWPCLSTAITCRVFASGFKLPSLVLNFFHPLALVYLVFALRRVYRQKWATVLKAGVLFVCEALLFTAVNIGGFIIAFTFCVDLP